LGDGLLGVFEKVESMHVSQTVDAELTMMGSPSKIYVNMESDVSVADQLMHSAGKAESNGMTFDVEMYVEKKGDNASVYANMNNTTWMKQDAPIAQLKQSNNYNDAFETAKFFLGALQGKEISEVTHMDKDAVLVTGVLDTEDPEGLMSSAGFGPSGINTGQFVQMMTGLEPVEVSLYVEKDTGLPLEFSADMTKFMTSMYENMGKAMGGTSFNVSIDHAICTLKFTEYNNVSVEIPEDVKDAVSEK